jgi:hypothetical protein
LQISLEQMLWLLLLEDWFRFILVEVILVLRLMSMLLQLHSSIIQLNMELESEIWLLLDLIIVIMEQQQVHFLLVLRELTHIIFQLSHGQRHNFHSLNSQFGNMKMRTSLKNRDVLKVSES